MGYSNFDTKTPYKARSRQVHPVWRGIGCLMMILIPVMAYAGAVLLVQANRTAHWLPMPAELAKAVAVPGIGNVPFLYANLMTAVVLSLLGFGVLVFLYALLYRFIGPSPYGPMDAPPDWERRG